MLGSTKTGTGKGGAFISETQSRYHVKSINVISPNATHRFCVILQLFRNKISTEHFYLSHHEYDIFQSFKHIYIILIVIRNIFVFTGFPLSKKILVLWPFSKLESVRQERVENFGAISKSKDDNLKSWQ